MSQRIAIVEGLRTPFCKQGAVFKSWKADELGAFVVRELLARVAIDPSLVDELIFGNVLQPPDATNIARVLAVKGGLPVKVPAFTVNRNCASGLESICSAMDKILLGRAEVIIAGGTESMSHFPLLFNDRMRNFLRDFSKTKTVGAKLKKLLSFRFGFLKPDMPGIQDPLCGLTMGQTAEILAREFAISRQEQDAFAFRSQKRAFEAKDKLADEIAPVPSFDSFEIQNSDDGIRVSNDPADLGKLRPVFDKLTGTVTAANASQVTDGAAAVLMMPEEKAKALGLEPLGYIVDYTQAALEPSKMGLGPAFAIPKLLEKTGKNLNQIDLIEINEAFAVQVLACQKALASDKWSKEHLGMDKAFGVIDDNKLNVNGGAIALGHPVGVSGTRLVLTLLKELKRQGKKTGVAALCVGGGQGQAALVEV